MLFPNQSGKHKGRSRISKKLLYKL